MANIAVAKSGSAWNVSWIPQPVPYSSRGIEASCSALLLSKTIGENIHLPPNKMKIRIGAIDGEYVYMLSFYTAAVDQEHCSSSVSVIANDRKTGYTLNHDETMKAQRRYNSKCVYDAPEIPSPSRTVTVSIYPVTDKDLVTWVCWGIWEEEGRHIYAPALNHHRIAPRWDSTLKAEHRHPQVQVIPRHGAEWMKVACVIPGVTLHSLKPAVSDETVLPQMDVKLLRKRNNIIDGVIYRDIYGRFSRTTEKATVLGTPQYDCTDRVYREQLIQCLGEDSTDQGALGKFGSVGCDDFIVIAAFHDLTETRSVNVSSNMVLNLFSLMQNLPLNKSVTFNDFNKRHIAVQLPSDNAIRPLRLRGSRHVLSLMPDAELIASIYTAVVTGIIERPFLKVVKIESYYDGLLKTDMTCGPGGGRIIFIASSVCISGIRSVVTGRYKFLDRRLQRVWCGEEGGHYSVYAVNIDDDEMVTITKRIPPYARDSDYNPYYSINDLSCVWQQYYCLIGTRTRRLESVTLLESFPEHMGDIQLSRYDSDISPETFEIISPDMCPACEGKFDDIKQCVRKINVTHAFNMEDIRILTKSTLQERPELRYLRTDETSSVSQLAFGCSCRQKLNLCNNDNISGLLGFAVIDPDTMHLNDQFICDAMGRESVARTYNDLLTDYVCGNSISGHSEGEHLIKLLPKPLLVINNSVEVLVDMYSYVRISCLNIKTACLKNVGQLGVQDGGTSFIIVRFSGNTSQAEIRVSIQRNISRISWNVYKPIYSYYEVKHMQPTSGMPIVLVNNPAKYSDGDEPFEILIKKSLLENYALGECTYLGLWSHDGVVVHISPPAPACAEEDYVFSSTKVSYAGTALICEVDYSNATRKGCDVPILSLPSFSSEDYDPCLAQLQDDTRKLERSVVYQRLHDDVGYCIYDIMHNKATTVLLPVPGNVNIAEFKCVVITKQIREQQMTKQQSHIVKKSFLVENVDEVPCLISPPIFRPVTTISSDDNSSGLFTAICSLPYWVHKPCHDNVLLRKNVLMYIEGSSNLRKLTRQNIAKLSTNGKCYSHPDYDCTTEQVNDVYDNRLLTVHFQKSMFYDIANEPGAVLKIACVMEEASVDVKHISLKSLTPVATSTPRSQTSQPVTELTESNLTASMYIFIVMVVPLSLVVIVTIVVLVLTAVVRASKNKKVLKVTRASAGLL